MNKLVSSALAVLVVAMMTSCSFSGSKPCFEIISTSFTELGHVLQGEEVILSNCSDDGLAFSWDFGDGQTSTLNSPHHVWEEPGDYTITLTVETEKNSRSLTKDITVNPSLYGSWQGLCHISSSTSIPISFEIIQVSTKLKGTFHYGLTGNKGAISSSHSSVSGDSVQIKCTYMSVFFFDGEEFSSSTLFSFEGTVNETLDQMQGESFSVGQRRYGAWEATKQ